MSKKKAEEKRMDLCPPYWVVLRIVGYTFLIAFGLVFWKRGMMQPIVIEREMSLAVFLATMIIPFIFLELGGLVAWIIVVYMESFTSKVISEIKRRKNK